MVVIRRFVMFLYFLNNILNRNRTCSHMNVPAGMEYGYCPDCGEFIHNRWYLCRCACCNVKRKSILQFSQVKPQEKYCANCGSKEFFVIEVPKINFIDINFAVLKKEIELNKNLHYTISQCWFDNFENIEKILLPIVEN